MSNRPKNWKNLWPLTLVRSWRDRQIERFYRRHGFLPIEETQEQDIFICGYPKSGNTWVQNLIASLLFGLEPAYLTDKLVQEVVPDRHQSRFYKRYFHTAYFKTHHQWSARYHRIVHLVRDPRDVTASYYHFDRARGREVSLDEKTESVIHSWQAHTESFVGDMDGRDVLLLRYEDLLTQPELEVKRLLDFCRLERSSEIQNRTIEGNRFSEISAREKIFGMANPKWPSENAFFRNGQSGSYIDTLSRRNVVAIESSLSDLMGRLGYYQNSLLSE